MKHKDTRRLALKLDDLSPVADDRDGGRTVRVEVRTSGQFFLLQMLENSPKLPQDDLRSKSVQHESYVPRQYG